MNTLFNKIGLKLNDHKDTIIRVTSIIIGSILGAAIVSILNGKAEEMEESPMDYTITEDLEDEDEDEDDGQESE